jgi:ABC-type glycerol-3-phosphate transport system substrate-binding protein
VRREVEFWWWGEDEAPGLGAWVREAAEDFTRTYGVPVALRHLRHDEVLTKLPDAASAGRPPDIHFLWNGIYHVDFVWRNLLEPLDGLFHPEELRAYGGGPQSIVGGLTYRLAWYVIPVVWVANRDVLRSAGVDALPKDWASLTDACARVQSAGYRPLTVGDGEGDFSVWWLAHFLPQCLGSPSELVDLVLGELDWRSGTYDLAWRRLAEVSDAGFLDRDALGLTLWEGLDRFNQGESAFTLASGPMFAATRRSLGSAATVLPAPRISDRAPASLPIIDTQGLGICSSERDPAPAADLLRTFYEPARRQALWDDIRLLPADRRWAGPPAGSDADYLTMWRWYERGPSAPYLPNLLPLDLHFELAAGIGQEILEGRLSAADAADSARLRCVAWAGRADTGRYARWARTVARDTRAA